MREIYRDLLSYLVTFLRMIGAMILLFPFGWVFILLGVLPEPKLTVRREHLKKVLSNVKR